jgi:hypothetical protein
LPIERNSNLLICFLSSRSLPSIVCFKLSWVSILSVIEITGLELCTWVSVLSESGVLRELIRQFNLGANEHCPGHHYHEDNFLGTYH